MLERGRGGLSIDGLAVEELARRFGTPLYVYSAAAVTERLEALRSAFAAQAPLICYALKANSNRAIISLLAGRGAGADVVSGGELLRARAAGVPADRIVFSGVGKTGEELALGLKQGILAFNVESSEELEALEALARSSRQRAPVMIRLNPGVDAGTHPHVATALPASKFGVAAPQALRLLERAAASRWLRARGIQCHIGSQITDPRPYERAARAVARTMAALARRGIVLELVDLGGGFGVRYEKERELPLRRLASSFCALMPAGPRLILEPGRWLVADAGLLLARVLYRKSAGGRRLVIVDAAMNDLARPALYGARHPILPARPRRGPERRTDIVGPICESVDFLARARRLGPVERGDILAVLKAGAYGFSMSSQYNSRPRAAEVLVEGGRARLIRRRETLKDIVSPER